MTVLWQLGAAALAQGYARGDFDPVDALEACLARAREGAALNAWVFIDEEGAKAAARESAGRWKRREGRGPLDGVPVSVKDNLHVQGWPTRWGSALASPRPREHDELPVARLRESGAVLIGKTALPEFAMQGFTASEVTGTTRNPWDPSLTPGGSSGGAAAAVAWGAGPLALITDGGGSTRRPASHCGLAGFKPSADLVPRGGGLPDLFLGYEVVGTMARSVADVRALTQAVSGRPLAAPVSRPLRILHVPRFGDRPVDPGIEVSVAQAARELAAAGHEVETAGPFDLADAVHAAWPSLSAAGLAWLAADPARLAQAGLPSPLDESRLSPGSRRVLAQGREQHASVLFELVQQARLLEAKLAALFQRHDVLLTPCTAALPWPADEPYPATIAGQDAGPRDHAVFTSLANAAGVPALALPTTPVGGVPTGLQLIGRRGDDALLLALGEQFEAARRRPFTWPKMTA